MNQHIHRFLTHYINLNISPEYALLVSGKWGSGKTFFINNYLETENHDNIKFIMISLFGVKSVDEIHKQIIFQLIGTKEGSLANSFIKIGSSLLDSLGKKINLGINDIPIEQVLNTLTKKLDKEIIFIFDDLERVTVSIPEVLGYINILVEKLQLKTILLANESELTSKHQYKEFKEKVIGKTFLLKQDFSTSFDTFVKLSNLSKIAVIENKIIIENIFINANYHNLRHVRQSLLDFEHFFENIEEKFCTNKELMQELIEIFFALSIEIKNGSLDIEDVKGLQHIKSYEYYDELKTAEESGEGFKRHPLDVFFEKYSFSNKDNLLLTEKMWIELFNFGTLEKTNITQSFENSQYFMVQSPQEWIPLWHYHELEDKDFQERLTLVTGNFENNTYKEHAVIMHVVGMLLRFTKLKLYDKTSEYITNKAKENIDKNLEIWSNSTDVDLDDSSFGLGYMEIDTDEFKEVKKYLLDKTYEAVNDGLEDIGNQLIETLKDNNFEEFKNMLSQDSIGNKLYELPVFSKMDVNIFFKEMLNIKHTTFRKIVPEIEKRYKQSYINESLVDELKFWEDFEILLNDEIPKREKSIKGVWLNIFKDRTIKAKILDNLNQAKDNKTLNQTEDSVG